MSLLLLCVGEQLYRVLPAEPSSFHQQLSGSQTSANAQQWELYQPIPLAVFFLHSLTIRMEKQSNGCSQQMTLGHIPCPKTLCGQHHVQGEMNKTLSTLHYSIPGHMVQKDWL